MDILLLILAFGTGYILFMVLLVGLAKILFPRVDVKEEIMIKPRRVRKAEVSRVMR
jgi:hypothetical protein